MSECQLFACSYGIRYRILCYYNPFVKRRRSRACGFFLPLHTSYSFQTFFTERIEVKTIPLRIAHRFLDTKSHFVERRFYNQLYVFVGCKARDLQSLVLRMCYQNLPGQRNRQYRGADKSLVRPGRKQATATEDFDFYVSYL